MFGTAQLPKFRDDQFFSTTAETIVGMEKFGARQLKFST